MLRLARRLLVAAPFAAAVFALSVDATAQITGEKNDTLPVPYARRPLTLPHMVLAPELTVSLTHLEFEGFINGNGAALDLGGSFGLLGDIELEATVISLAMGDFIWAPTGLLGANNDFDWGVSRFGATLRFLASDAFEMGGTLRLMVDNSATFGINFGVPMRIHGGDVLRIDTGIFATGLVNDPGIRLGLGNSEVFSLTTTDGNPLGPDPGIPLDLYINAIPQLFFNLGTGFGVLDVSEDQTIFIPLELGVGGTIAGRDEPLVDIFASFSFPALFLPASDGDQAFTNLWQIGLGAKGFVPLGG